MSAQPLSAAATDLIASYGNTARHLVRACRIGGDRVVGLFEQRWERTLQDSGPALAPDLRDQALHTQKLLGGYCARGLVWSTNSADALIGHWVRMASLGVQQAAAHADLLQPQTGSTALRQLSEVVAPATAAARRAATQLERKTAALADLLARSEDTADQVHHVSPFRRARERASH